MGILLHLLLAGLIGGRWLHLCWQTHSAVRIGALNRSRTSWEWPRTVLGIVYLGALLVWASELWTAAEGPLSAATPLVATGLGLGATGCGLRIGGQHVLKDAFSFGSSVTATTLVTHGIYRRLKHPLILGYVLEVVAMLLVSRAPWPASLPLVAGLAAAASVQLRREERSLHERFGDTWVMYARDKLL